MNTLLEVGTPIFQQLNHNLQKGTGMSVENMDRIYLPKWAKAKQSLFDFFGQQLVVSRKIKQSKMSKVDIIGLFNDEVLKDDRSQEYVVATNVFKSLELNEVLTNKLEANLTIFGKLYNGGTKISKVLQDMVLPEHKEEFSLRYSLFVQKTKNCETTIHISIDPRDFITMSINRNNWQTCQHALEGDYRTAVLSTMVDGVTAIAYVSKSTAHFPHLDMDWNNKQWRAQLYISPENGKGVLNCSYPYSNPTYDKEIQDMVLELFQKKFGADFSYTQVSMYDHVTEHVYVDDNYMYNDIEHKDCGILFRNENVDKGSVMQVGVAELTCIGCHRNCYIDCCHTLFGHRCGGYDDDEDYDDDDYDEDDKE